MLKYYSEVKWVVRNWHWNECHKVSELNLSKSYKDHSQSEHGHFWPLYSRTAQQRTPMFNTGLHRQTQETLKGRDWRETLPRWWNNTLIAKSCQKLGRINLAKTSEPWAGKVIFAFMLRLIKFTLSLHVFNIVYILFALRPISAYKARCLMDTILIQLDWRGHMCHMKTVACQTVFWHCSKKKSFYIEMTWIKLTPPQKKIH